MTVPAYAKHAHSAFYERVPLQGRLMAANGFYYARVPDLKCNYVEIGLGYESTNKLNLQHQQLDQVHYQDVIPLARRISQYDGFKMTDGPLTARFFGDEQDYRERALQRARSHGSDRRSEYLRSDATLYSRDLGAAMVRAHRAGFGDPLFGSDIIEMPEDRSTVDLVVRFDQRLKLVMIGVTPKITLDAEVPAHLVSVADWEFLEIARLTKRTLGEAIERWAPQNTAVQFGAPWIGSRKPHVGPVFVEGAELEKLVQALQDCVAFFA